jgi:hypothetical protein
MPTYPVQFEVTRPLSFERHQVVLRLLILLLAMLGSSMAWIFGVLYLFLPAFVAVLVSQKDGERFMTEDAGKLKRLLHWILAIYSYLALLTDRLPTDAPERSVNFEVTTAGRPTPASALLRLVYSLPALVFFALLSLIASLAWMVSMVLVLVQGTYPDSFFRLQCGVMRLQARLLAYHASLVEAYPPFTLDLHGEPSTPDATAGHVA